MKSSCARPRIAESPRAAPFRPVRRLVLLGALGFALLPVLAGGNVLTEIGVRSAVAERASKPGRSAEREIFSIGSIQQISGERLISPPVDVGVLLRHIRVALESRDFRPVGLGQRPDIVFAVEYGRDWLDNPYLEGTRDLPPMVGVSSVTPESGVGLSLEHKPHQTIAGVSTQLMSQLDVGREGKIQKAKSEKLYIRLNAWQYQADAKARPRLLWVTTMVVDDPDNVDLNEASTAMLAAGATYFGEAIRDGEVTVRQPEPEGRVKVGTPQVLDAVADPIPAPPPVAAPVSGRDTGKVFNLPAGDAAATLQEYSRQSGVEVIYPFEQVQGVRTGAVSGKLDPPAALERMLKGTDLVAVRDQATGAVAVRPRRSR